MEDVFRFRGYFMVVFRQLISTGVWNDRALVVVKCWTSPSDSVLCFLRIKIPRRVRRVVKFRSSAVVSSCSET